MFILILQIFLFLKRNLLWITFCENSGSFTVQGITQTRTEHKTTCFLFFKTVISLVNIMTDRIEKNQLKTSVVNLHRNREPMETPPPPNHSK